VCFSATFNGFLAIIFKPDGIIFLTSLDLLFGMVLFAMPIKMSMMLPTGSAASSMESTFNSEVA